MANKKHKNPPLKEDLKFENDLMELRLQVELGMTHLHKGDDIPEEVRSEFLNNVYEFEKQYAENRQVLLYDYIKRPPFRKAEELSPVEITAELQRLREHLRKHRIELGVIYKYSDEVIYKFMTEEFFMKSMNDISIMGMTSHFIYEDYHPNFKEDMDRRACEFIEALLKNTWDDFFSDFYLKKETEWKGKKYNRKELSGIIQAFQESMFKIRRLKIKITNSSYISGSTTGCVTGLLSYESRKQNKSFDGEFEICLALSYNCWGISQVSIPGF